MAVQSAPTLVPLALVTAMVHLFVDAKSLQKYGGPGKKKPDRVGWFHKAVLWASL